MTKLIVLVGFVLAFGAGMMAASRFLPPPMDEYGPASPGRPDEMGGPTTRPRGGPFGGRRGGFLPRELDLTAEQQAKLREIWSNVASVGPREMEEKKRALGAAKDAEVAKLIPADKQEEFKKLQSEFLTKLDGVDDEFRANFENAVKQTEAMLTEEQRKKYEEIRSRMQPHDGPGHGPFGGHGPPMGPPGGFDDGPGGPHHGPHDRGGF